MMPIWQFELVFVPEETTRLVRTSGGYLIPPLGIDTGRRLVGLVDAELGRPFVVGSGIRSYGRLDSNHMDVLGDAAQGYEMWACIDACADSDHFCKTVCQLAALLHCRLFSPELGLIIDPGRRALETALMNSIAWVYALDPSQFRKSARGWIRV